MRRWRYNKFNSSIFFSRNYSVLWVAPGGRKGLQENVRQWVSRNKNTTTRKPGNEGEGTRWEKFSIRRIRRDPDPRGSVLLMLFDLKLICDKYSCRILTVLAPDSGEVGRSTSGEKRAEGRKKGSESRPIIWLIFNATATFAFFSPRLPRILIILLHVSYVCSKPSLSLSRVPIRDIYYVLLKAERGVQGGLTYKRVFHPCTALPSRLQ